MTALRGRGDPVTVLMAVPRETYRMTRPAGSLYDALIERGVSRRTFLKFSATMAAALALPATYAPRIAEAVATAPRLPVIWLHGQACGGDTLMFLRASEPTTAALVLDLLSVDYDQTLMAAAGATAEQARADVMKAYPHGYLAIVEGSIPTADGGVHGTVGGRTLLDVAREVCGGALGTIAVGSCAFDGGAPAARGGTTGAAGVSQVVSSPRFIALPGCPANVVDVTAAIVHYLTFKEFPASDGRGRPLFAYGGLIHNQCERRAHFEFGEFVESWGDEGAQKGWCLYKMGCKGPETFGDCPTVKYGEKTSWPVRAGAGCIGCRMPGFWDAAGTAYRRLPSPVPFMPNVTADQVGAVLVGGVAALTVVHGGASIVRSRIAGRGLRRPRIAARETVPAASASVPAEAGPTAEGAILLAEAPVLADTAAPPAPSEPVLVAAAPPEPLPPEAARSVSPEAHEVEPS